MYFYHMVRYITITCSNHLQVGGYGNPSAGPGGYGYQQAPAGQAPGYHGMGGPSAPPAGYTPTPGGQAPYPGGPPGGYPPSGYHPPPSGPPPGIDPQLWTWFQVTI